jgi:hypothetical protein
MAKKKSIIQREMMLFFSAFHARKRPVWHVFFGCFAISFFNCNTNIAALAVTSRYFAPFCPFLSLFASEQIMAIVATSACSHDLVF